MQYGTKTHKELKANNNKTTMLRPNSSLSNSSQMSQVCVTLT